MPSKPRPGIRPMYVELPEDLADALAALAERNSRKIKAEVVLAIKAHLAANGPAAAVRPARGKKGGGKK